MSNIDKRALREAAERAGQNDWEYVYTSDLSAPGRGYITVGGAEAIYCLNKAAGGVKQSENVLRYIAAASPETMLALLDELEAVQKTSAARLGAIDTTHKMFQRERARAEAAEKRIAELSHHLQCAHGFIEHTEAFGHEASNGILCCGDAQWNIDESKLVLAAAGKGE
ncbi:TPA: ead/Ea22-like family protein [Enterobacter cloacae]|nr:ead/Ea22-like family protein [Enterobacter cloacae]HBC2543814.1 ead/Ea22-like family protein [Enterobacter cloacae]